MIGTGLLGHALVVQDVAGLLIELPAQAEIEGQIVLDPPVILEVESCVVLLETQDRLPVRKLSENREILNEVLKTRR